MIVIICENIPKNIRGILQIWFLEIKPSVFVGNLNKKIEDKIVKFLQPNINENTDMIIIRNDDTNSQGFKISYPSNNKNKLINISGQTYIQKQ